ncbi:MAG: hypothetical protein J0L77_09495 [Alphaproteobacteria bacterium]|nr:hypothetical protein [Alphaproteobacteria bacterium]
MTPEPQEVTDPSDSVLKETIAQRLKGQNAPPQSQYDFARIDLNRDGQRDALVLYRLPHTYWCSWSGCLLSIFRAEENGFTFINDIPGIRGPLVISSNTSEGWRDIIIELSGTQLYNRRVTLAFSGSTYPSTPMNAPSAPYRVLSDAPGTRVFQ